MGYGGSHFKVFTETNKGLEWFKDADKFGNLLLINTKEILVSLSLGII